MLECISFIVFIAILLITIQVHNKFISNNKREVIMIVGLGLLAFVIFFRTIIFGGYQLSFSNIMYGSLPFSGLPVEWTGAILSDPIDECLPWIYQIFEEHNLLLWTSSAMFGMPVLLAKFILNPSNIGYLFGMEFGQALQFIIKYTTAFVGMYLYLKNIKLNKYAAYAGAITYTFASVIVMWGGWPHSDVIALAPFLFYAVDKLILLYRNNSSENKVKYYLLFTFALYIMLIVGMPTYVVYYIYLGIVYAIYRLLMVCDVKRDYKFMLFFFVTIGIAIICAAVLSLPYLGELYGQVDEYTEVRLEYAFWYVDWEYIRGFIFPYATNTGGMHLNECSVYIGLMFIFSIILMPLYYRSLEKNQKRDVIFWGSTFVIMLIFVFTEWSGYIYRYFPLIDSSYKYRLIVLMNFAGTIIVAWTIHCLVEYQSKKIGGIVLAVPLVVLILGHDFLASEGQEYVLVLLILLAILLSAYMFVKETKWRKGLMILLMVVMTCDSAYFASQYLPLIEDDASMIPEAIPSISYLQDETESGERVMPLGKWTLFPMSNTFYDLDIISGHGFINTNEDMINYLTLIDEEAYDSYTRTSIKSVANYNLLAYASVKYLYYENEIDELSLLQELLDANEATREPVLYDGSYSVVQSFTVMDDTCDYMAILLSTYGTELSEQDILTIKIYSGEETLIYTEEVLLSDLQDNSFLSISLEDSALEGNGEQYYLELIGNQTYENPIALWLTTESIYEGDCNYDESNGDISFVLQEITVDENAVIDNVVIENMVISELEEYSERTFIATDIVVTESLEESLALMAEDYIPDTVFMTEDIYNKYDFSTESGAEDNYVISYEDFDDEVFITVQTSGNNMLVLTDYYYDGWKAYVDGEEVEIEKVNYLFRGIYLEEAGEHEIVFEYYPQRITYEYIAYFIMMLGLVIVFIYRKKVDEFITEISRKI